MAANFQHMAGNGQMMPQQQQQQRLLQEQQRRTQGVNIAAISNVIMNAINSQNGPGPLPGWQNEVLTTERMGYVLNLINNFRLISPPNSLPLQKMMEMGLRLERESFEKATNKEMYKQLKDTKLGHLLQQRNLNQPMLQQQVTNQAQMARFNQEAGGQQQMSQAQQQMMMNAQNNMAAAQATRPMPQQPFSHLQHQMQASPLPGHQPPMGMPNPAMPQNFMQAQQQQQQQQVQQQQQQQQQAQQQQAQQQQAQQQQAQLQQQQQQQFQANLQRQRSQSNVPQGRLLGGQMSERENELITSLANQMFDQASEEERNAMRNSVMAKLDPTGRAQMQAQGHDPARLAYRTTAIQRLRQKQRMTLQAQQLALAGGQQQSQNPLPTGQPMQPQRSLNPNALAGTVPAAAAMGGTADFPPFMGNMGVGDLAAQQQQQGVLAEQAGQMVVPASGGPRNATPQPGLMPGGLNDQRNTANLNPRAQQQQQQQMLHAQQLQQQQRAQQQSQNQARILAQNKAQQMGFQGQQQPGGMGAGAAPPQQSPAMGTLNPPMRTPSQQMNHPENPQVIPPSKFNAPLDPRFLQGGPRQIGPGFGLTGMQQTIYNSLGPEGQQQMANMPPEKLDEAINQWMEKRVPLQNGRPQMPMQGNPQVRSGQPINLQNSAGQSNSQNAPVRPSPSMVTGMNPAQQMMLQQQMINMQQQNQMQSGGAQPPGGMQPNMMQIMDQRDIPPAIFNHASMPRNFPPDIKKWGQLKQWTMAQNLPSNIMDGVMQLQTLHYKHWIEQRNKEQKNIGGNMQTGLPEGPNGNATIPAGMAAPVAPMVPNPQQMQNGVNTAMQRQPTVHEIQSARNHPNGRLKNATDEQIRVLLLKNQQMRMTQQAQMNPQQLQHFQQLQQQRQQIQQMNHMQHMQQQQMMQQSQAQPRQQNPPTPQIQQPSQAPGKTLPHTKPTPTPAQKAAPAPTPQSSDGAPPPTANNAPSGRAPRPQTNAKGQVPQSSSPAQSSKNLKRVSSDDVVEVPNPNAAQPAQPPQPATQNRNQLSGPRTLTPEQIAALNPEQRKNWERYRAAQAAQAARMNAAAHAPVDPVALERFEAIAKVEHEKLIGAFPDIAMDESTRQITANAILNLLGPLMKTNTIVHGWFSKSRNEDLARMFVRVRSRVLSQFKDKEMKVLKDKLSITKDELQAARGVVISVAQNFTAMNPSTVVAKPDAANQQASPAQPAQSAVPPAPLNAANLLEQQQQLTKGHKRTNSRSQAPAAPTSSHAPFQLGASSSPNLATFVSTSKLTQENLHLPPRKKHKQSGTPGSTASPQVTKAPSPEIKRQGDPRPQAVAALTCPEPDCDRHTAGFESEEALSAHRLDEHIRPLEDPAKFAVDSAALLMAKSGSGSKSGQAISSMTQNAPTPITAPDALKQEQAPNVKAGTASAAATPMNRQVSMNRHASTDEGKSKPTPPPDASAKSQAVPKESRNSAQQEPLQMDPWGDSMFDPHDLEMTFAPFESGAGGAISNMNVYRSLTPNDTPESSKDGVSEPNSDISEGVALDINIDLVPLSVDDWHPFGPSDVDNHLFGMDPYHNQDVSMFAEEPDMPMDYHFDDMIDSGAFDKRFEFDSSLYSMNAN